MKTGGPQKIAVRLFLHPFAENSRLFSTFPGLIVENFVEISPLRWKERSFPILSRMETI